MSKHVTLAIDPGSDLARAVVDPETSEVTVEIDGRLFDVIERESSNYWKSTSFSEHAAKFSGILEGIDADGLKNDIQRWRREGSRPSGNE